MMEQQLNGVGSTLCFSHKNGRPMFGRHPCQIARFVATNRWINGFIAR
ncbi:hypothetical protein A8V23_19100 [Yersinia pestis]|nr:MULTISPECIES: hypothetical protein [Yersinia pseudotuberculosis complex]AEL73035.1 hypothetical protein A1122_12015 [Yersinia pestis A1122]AKS80470.1 hypothetical protein M481_1306 [Yersinia pestis 1522]EIQ86711.1 hypothetical protein YPPY01_3173 [Yersinia pestis PY-01]EIQ87693.1 hypothetical protein YPPY02_3212 [Yersinia pestis PY-02]EIQ88326.1 hypothetical protein YPPY03_3275 [Yersinia pestis PY-03]EIR00024.1 hypothetical protein YPPY04_3232 [Yersinia pestis PY-04]EIR01237.1 hypothetica